MGDTEQKREAIKSAFPSRSWKEKVDKMSPEQVAAIYIRFKSEGKIGRYT